MCDQSVIFLVDINSRTSTLVTSTLPEHLFLLKCLSLTLVTLLSRPPLPLFQLWPLLASSYHHSGPPTLKSGSPRLKPSSQPDVSALKRLASTTSSAPSVPSLPWKSGIFYSNHLQTKTQDQTHKAYCSIRAMQAPATHQWRAAW